MRLAFCLFTPFLTVAASFPLAILLAAEDSEKAEPVDNGEACVRPGSPKISDGLYNLQYDSWIRRIKDQDDFTFGRCIKTLTDRKVFVDWKKTGVKGFATPDQPATGGVQAPTSDFENMKTELWYGAQPKKTESSYREVKAPKDEGQGNTRATPTLRSYVRMSLPVELPKNEAEEEIAKLHRINVEFESSAMRLPGDKFLYTYSWRNKTKEDLKGLFAVVWPRDLVRVAEETDPEWRQSAMSLAEETQGFYIKHSRSPDYGVVTVEFISIRTKEIVGSTPVSVYRPHRVP